MTVPSYDDLTPGIPDVADSHTGAVSRHAGMLTDAHARPTTEHAAVVADSHTGAVIGHAAVVNEKTAPPPHLFGDDRYACLFSVATGALRPARAALLRVARDFSPRVMAVGDAEVLLDVSGLGRLIGEPPAIVRELTRALADARIEAHATVAPTQTAARLLARQPAGFPVERLGDLPVAWLASIETVGRDAGISAGATRRDRVRPFETLERWGMTTLGELAALPPAGVSSRLGRRGASLQRLARGLDVAPLVPDPETPRYRGQLELEWPIDTLEPLTFVFARLLEPLADRLERADRAAAALRLDLRLTDRMIHTRTLQLPAPIRDPRVLRTLLQLDLESHPPAAAVDVVAIELDPAPSRITQFSLLTRALPSPDTLSTLIARLAAIAGESRVGSPRIPDTRRPAAFEMARFAPAAPGLSAPVASAASLAAPVPAVLRRLRTPLAIRIQVAADGRPAHVAAARRGVPSGAVTQAAGPWRTSGDWWTQASWHRDEWDVALADGSMCRLFQDRVTSRWFFDGIYD